LRDKKVEKFLSQPLITAEVFTGVKGKNVPLEETIAGFKAIVEGECDNMSESAFYMVGSLQDAKIKQCELNK